MEVEAPESTSPFPRCLPFHTPHPQGKGQPKRAIGQTELEVRIKQRMSLRWSGSRWEGHEVMGPT